jgi:hypothetical protein
MHVLHCHDIFVLLLLLLLPSRVQSQVIPPWDRTGIMSEITDIWDRCVYAQQGPAPAGTCSGTHTFSLCWQGVLHC